MLKRTTLSLILLGLSLLFSSRAGWAQETSPEDENVNAIRNAPVISANGDRLIAQWVQAKVDKLAAAPETDHLGALAEFRKAFAGYDDAGANSEQFRTHLAAQTAAIAARLIGKNPTSLIVARSLAHVLAEMNERTPRTETFSGLVAGLTSPLQVVRYLCAKGLAALRGGIAADKAKLTEGVAALGGAGLVETSPIVLGRIYLALAHRNQVDAVFDAYMAVLDKRLTFRRGSAVIADGAEYEAYEFFRKANVLSALSNDQKAQLVRRVAVFLRLDAQRYASPDLQGNRKTDEEEDRPKVVVDFEVYREGVRLEQLLDGGEAILEAIVGSAAGTIRAELRAGGHSRCRQVLQQAYLWVGNPQTKAPGALNKAPWDVEIGAP